MTFEILFVLALLALAVILFASEKLPVDLVALILMTTLLLSGIISPDEGIAGFSNTATITIGAMFVLSAGLSKTGAANRLGSALGRLFKRSLFLGLAVTMALAGAISAFMNNTPVVAIFIPMMLSVARDHHLSPSKLLMPLSFASIFGGVCTIIGTSTNILVAAIAERYGQPAIKMFEFTGLGMVFLGAGILYMLVFGISLLPNRRTTRDLTQTFGMGDYLTEVILLPKDASVGKPLAESPLVQELDIDIIGINRGGEQFSLPRPERILQAGDVLRVRCNVEKIKKLQERGGVKLKPGLKWRDQDLESAHAVLAEVVVAPNSMLEAKTLKQARFRNAFGATVLAIRHRGVLIHENLENTELRAGDALLVEVKRDRLAQLKQDRAFVIVSEVGLPEFRRDKVLPALAIILGVVLASSLELAPIVVSAITGALLMILTKCLTLEEAYKTIEWPVIFLLAGVLTLGVAMEKTGAAGYVANALVSIVGAWGPMALLSAFFLLTMLLTNVMSNNATAALLAPIAIASAQSQGLSARPFLIAVMFAASMSFMTPVGYQTNTLIYGPGLYRFVDFLKVGTPLSILFWLLATLLIPRFWPF